MRVLLCKKMFSPCHYTQSVAGGAGGKGTWGKPGSEIDGLDRVDDIRDPNYDSDTQVSGSLQPLILITELPRY